jgi:methyl-accepting chemotaxis protein
MPQALQGLEGLHTEVRHTVDVLRSQVRSRNEELKRNEAMLEQQERQIAEAAAALSQIAEMMQRVSGPQESELASDGAGRGDGLDSFDMLQQQHHQAGKARAAAEEAEAERRREATRRKVRRRKTAD